MQTELRLDWWEAARDRMRRVFDGGRFERWLEALVPVAVDGERIELGVPNTFVLEWVQSNYLAELREILSEAVGADREVALRVTPRAGSGSAVAPEPNAPAGTVFPNAPSGRTETGSRPGSAGAAPEAGPAPDGAEASLEGLVFGTSNRLALSAAVEVLERPGDTFNPFLVYGPSGVGKTHLLRAIHAAFRGAGRCRQGAGRRPRREPAAGSVLAALGRVPDVPAGLRVRFVPGERFFHHFVASVQDGTLRRFRELYREQDVLILDDFQTLVSKKKTLVEFQHTFNALVDAGKQVVIACDAPPHDLDGVGPALVGRLAGGLSARIEKPDFETRLEILKRRATRLQTRFDARVLEFLAENVRGNPRELIGALNQLDAHARIGRDDPDVEFAHTVLAERLREQQRRVTLRRIHDTVAAHYGLTADVLASRNRQRIVVRARQLAMYFARRYTGRSLADIGRHFGGRNHATVKSAIDRVTALSSDPGTSVPWDLRAIVGRLEDGG